MLTAMTRNAAGEQRFRDAAQFFWQSAQENLSYVKDAVNPC